MNNNNKKRLLKSSKRSPGKDNVQAKVNYFEKEISPPKSSPLDLVASTVETIHDETTEDDPAPPPPTRDEPNNNEQESLFQTNTQKTVGFESPLASPGKKVDPYSGNVRKLRSSMQEVDHNDGEYLETIFGPNLETVSETNEDEQQQRRSSYFRRPKISLHRHMYWMFSTQFSYLFLYFFMVYYVIIILFTLIIMFVNTMDDPCCQNIPENYLVNGPIFVNAFALSWTTFSTVGYGNVWPGLVDKTCNSCVGIQFFLIIEVFCGVLFAGTCGAIMFGKVERILSQGQIKFSKAIVIRYGSGLKYGVNDADDDTNKQCPVLEFRMMNLLHAYKDDGEKIDNIVSSIASIQLLDKPNVSKESSNVPKRMFKDMKLTNPEHPFLKYAWTIVHVLDQKSPLLKPSMTNHLEANNGKWPVEYCNIEKIKKNLDFCQILVKYSGKSRITGSEVFAKTVYCPDDVLIGYKFVNLLDKRKKESVKFNADYFDHVIEQDGTDGAEQLYVNK